MASPTGAKKGRRPRVKTGPRGVEYRRVYQVGNTWCVSLAPACRRLLGVEDGGTVQVLPHPSGKVVIAPMRMRVAVAEELVSAQRELVRLRGQVVKLKRKLYGLPKRQVRQGFSIGYQQARRA